MLFADIVFFTSAEVVFLVVLPVSSKKKSDIRTSTLIPHLFVDLANATVIITSFKFQIFSNFSFS